MKIIVAPAKKMTNQSESFRARRQPQFLAEAQEILAAMKALDYARQKKCGTAATALPARTSPGYRR